MRINFVDGSKSKYFQTFDCDTNDYNQIESAIHICKSEQIKGILIFGTLGIISLMGMPLFAIFLFLIAMVQSLFEQYKIYKLREVKEHGTYGGKPAWPQKW